MLFLITSAFALDCTGLDPEVCADTNAVLDLTETVVGSPVFSDTSGPTRLLSTTVYAHLLSQRLDLAGAGCTIDALAAGSYMGNTFDGLWENDTDGGSTLGVYNAQVADWTGEYLGIGLVGSHYGQLASQHYVADLPDDDFAAGRYVRVAGGRGAWYGYTGSCASETAKAIDPWFPGDLAPWYSRRIFASDTWVNPMTGLAPMDSHCQDQWDAYNPTEPASFIAAVTDQPNGIDSPAQRFSNVTTRPIHRSGTNDFVIDNVDDFFNYTIRGIPLETHILADGSSFSATTGAPDSLMWWGGFGPTATLGFHDSSTDCDGWTTTIGDLDPSPGPNDPPGTETKLVGGLGWTDEYFRFWAFQSTCANYASTSSRLYCIEE